MVKENNILISHTVLELWPVEIFTARWTKLPYTACHRMLAFNKFYY